MITLTACAGNGGGSAPAAGGTSSGGAAGAGGSAPDTGADGAVDHDAGQTLAAFCTAAPEPEQLSPPETVVGGRSDLAYVAVSREGVIWSEGGFASEVRIFSAQGSAAQQLFELHYDQVSIFCGPLVASGDYFGFGFLATSLPPAPVLGFGGTVLADGQAGSEELCTPGLNDNPIAADASGVYVARGSLARLRWSVAGSCETKYLGATAATGVATDSNSIYLFVPEAADGGGPGSYSIQRVSKSDGTWTTLAGGIDPMPPKLPSQRLVMHVAANAIYWSHPYLHDILGGATTARRIWVLPPGATSCQILVDDQDGLDDFAADERYVYWTTATGLVKRVRNCGGTPETIAEHQDHPESIAVDDSAIYWLDEGTDPGTGKVMRIRKLDAADAGAASDASDDASLDAAPDTSVDGGGVDSGVGDSGGG